MNYVTCPDAAGGHRMAYWSWGDAAAGHAIVCAHGISRQGRDFEVLARALVEASAAPLRVIAPDIVGRGRSDWLKDPAGYAIPAYVPDVLAMLGQLHREAPIAVLDWVGTSMGGLLGIVVAGAPDLPLPTPIRRLVLNDVGPVVQWQALQRIGSYLGQVGRFDTVQQAADAMWAISRPFGPHTPAEWLALSEPMVKPLPEGGFTLHYDPAIAVPMRGMTEESAAQGSQAIWQLYDRITAATLLVRGAESDVLSKETALEMTRRGPKARLLEIVGVGHAPTFVAPSQSRAVCDFLLP